MKIIRLGMFTALAMALQAAEALLPFGGAIPGGKLGLANIITILVYRLYGAGMAFAVTGVRAVLGGLLFGGITMIPYSLCGGILALLIMFSTDRLLKGLSNTGMAVAGAFAHNTAQVLVACATLGSLKTLNYLWILGPVSVIAGIFTGITATLCLRIMNRMGKQTETRG